MIKRPIETLPKRIREWASFPSLNLSDSSKQMLNAWADIIEAHLAPCPEAKEEN